MSSPIPTLAEANLMPIGNENEEDWYDDDKGQQMSSPIPCSSLDPFSSPITIRSVTPTPAARTGGLPSSSSTVLATPQRSAPIAPRSSPLYTPISQLLSQEGIIPSSSIRGTPGQRRQKRMAKGRKRQKLAIAQIQQMKRAVNESSKHRLCESALRKLKAHGVRFGDLLKYVSDPSLGQGRIRWHDFFVFDGAATEILNFWVSSKNSKPAREEVKGWAVGFVAGEVAKEARRVTKTGELQTLKRPINHKVVTTFDIKSYTARLSSEWAPIAMTIISAFSTSQHVDKHTEKRQEKTALVQTMAGLMCLGEYSRANNLVKRMMALYLYASGAQRQTINVLSKLGYSESYSSLISSRLRRPRKRKQVSPEGSVPEVTQAEPPGEGQRLGTLYQLSDSVRAEARAVAATGKFGVVYDNINIAFSNSEQILGRHDTQENGTCATLFTLNGPVSTEDLDLCALQESFLDAPPLDIHDILLTAAEQQEFNRYLVATILRVIVEFGGESFRKFRGNMDDFQPQSELKLEPQQTKLFPLPAWNIDESSTIGNIQVVDAITDELKLKEHPEFNNRVRFLAGDQLSIGRLRSIETLRAGHEEGYAGFFWSVNLLGLFHTNIADIHGFILTHFGKPNAGTSNPGSLSFHNTRLNRLPITLSSLPPFRVCRDLIYVSLYARVLHCLLLVSNSQSLDDYMKSYGTWDQLVSHAQQIFDKFAQPNVVEDLRWKRRMSTIQGQPSQGDMVFENAILFMRDAIVSKEFADAIKTNDPGRIVLVLKHFSLSFRGNGRVKYAYEMLHIIHHIKHIWPASIRQISLNNMVLNPTGNPEGGVPADLVQEHGNLLAKTKYKARGSNASWHFMFTVTPCTESLRVLNNNFNSSLGSDLGTKHADARLAEDIQSLMNSLKEHKVYSLQVGRVTQEDDPPVPDIVTVGLQQLTGPLEDYNRVFQQLQKRRRMSPITAVGDDTPDCAREETTPISSSPRASSTITSSTLADLTPDIPELQGYIDTTQDMIESELQQIARDLEEAQEEESLACLSLRDVAFDMGAGDSDDEWGTDLESESDGEVTTDEED
ncbi:hypothetical protein EST38_g2525 [Candolleomyces aberdarensis]|uniref:DUF6589 domain-containing protein n=1 Tax=Candolleomyces aberdarensis TaxID=2316362 RepID=A0A4Q2DSP9_9AGAR|nr:hypothetical protein EST38_g2525 [Candolleomyces aberdarensis]